MSQLIIYYSRAAGNYVSGSIQELKKGNTEVVAEMLQELTGADLFQVESLVSYSDDYSVCIEEAKQDQKRDARPELKAYPGQLEQVETIYLGYPNYWGTMPMPMFTLLEKYDFTGKTIRPFCTHEGSGLGRSVEDIKKLCPGANVTEGLALKGSTVEASKEKVKGWLTKI